jgi:hypothetical protein
LGDTHAGYHYFVIFVLAHVGESYRASLILAWIAQPAMHGLHRFPLTVVEQAVEILTGGVPLRLSAEAGAEPIEVVAQASQEHPRGPCRHARGVRDSARQYKSNLIEGRRLQRVNLTK